MGYVPPDPPPPYMPSYRLMPDPPPREAYGWPGPSPLEERALYWHIFQMAFLMVIVFHYVGLAEAVLSAAAYVPGAAILLNLRYRRTLRDAEEE